MKKNIKFTAYLQIFILTISSISSASARSKHTSKSETQDIATGILATYGESDLSKKPAFQGGYINFGYWKNIHKNVPFSNADRAVASFELYKLAIDQLNIMPNDRILEVGCGLGYGCKYVASLYNPATSTCIDIIPQQIERAKIIHKDLVNSTSVQFEVAAADNTNLLDGSYSKIYSVEAAQYFPSMPKFADEVFRLLEPKGLLVITAHFSSNEKGYSETKKLLPTVAAGIDRMIPIEQVRSAVTNKGFKELKFESIGKYVFKNFDQWISQVNDEPWAHNIFKLYQDGHIDYYLIVLQKP